MNPNYNKIAGIYDTLTFMVFGNALNEARTANLDCIKEKDRVLIVGGGTGQVLSDLNIRNQDIEIDFVDLSRKMIEIAQKRPQQNIKVKYHQVDVLSFIGTHYDIIICNFFLDQFSAPDILLILKHLRSKLTKNGLLLYSDFQPIKNYTKKILIHLMYMFFRFAVKLKKVILTEHKVLFDQSGFKHESTISLNKNIFISVYRN